MVKKLHRKYKCVIYVVVQSYPLFWGMVMYDNDFETMENKIYTKDKIEPQHIYSCKHHMGQSLKINGTSKLAQSWCKFV